MEYTFNTNSITIPEGTIMHEWERPIMKELAKWACTNGGHIIEFGFGMGISAQYIQQHSIKSHTICEINPKVISNLKKWAHNKPNVIIKPNIKPTTNNSGTGPNTSSPVLPKPKPSTNNKIN